MNSNEILEEETTQQKLRREALLRKTDFSRPEISLRHQPINRRQCQQLHKQLASHVKPRVDQIKRHYDLSDIQQTYKKAYTEFAIMNMRDQNKEQEICQSIKEMHNMAQILMNPPDFKARDLYLYKKQQPSQLEQEQISTIYHKYQKAYKTKEPVEESEAEEAIRRAKVFLLKGSDYNKTL